VTYGLTRTNIQSFNQASTLLFESIQFRSIVGPSALDGIVSSTISPSLTYNTINNPQNPTTGKSFFYSASFSGLGGNVKTISNAAEFKMFHPVNKRRNVIGFRLTTAYITGYAGGQIPPFSRFYMGGENDIRGFDIRSISPVTFIPTETAQPVFYKDLGGITRSFNVPVLIYTATLPGGDYQGFGNFEYRIPIVGPVTAGLFFDGGTVGVLRRSALQLNQSGFDNLTMGPFAHFPNAPNPPNFPDLLKQGDSLSQQLSISPGTNFRLRGSAGIEFVVQLPIVQAPFRIYYAYNINRFHSQIFAKDPFVDPNEKQSILNGFDPATANLILEQLKFQPSGLNFFEPKTTFRFTVSRTF
jgi:outer membrane protein insertion porin family